LNLFQIVKNLDFMRNFIAFPLLKKQGFYKTPQIYDLVGVLHAARQAKSKIWDGAVRGAIPDGDAGATVYSERVSTCIPLFPPRVGGQGG